MNPFYTYQFEDLLIFQTPTLWKTYKNYNYIISRGNKATIIDPGELEPIQNTIEKNNLQIETIILTHHHPDHVGATDELKKLHKCEVLGFQGDQKRLPALTKTYFENEELEIQGHKAKVLFLPGHTLGLCAFYFEKLELLFSNDLIFSLGCGRVFEGTFEQMFESLKTVRALPNSTIIFSSHEYTLQNLMFGQDLFPLDDKLQEVEALVLTKLHNKIPTVPTTIGFEKLYNPFLRWDDPIIRKFMELEDADDWQVFAEIRRLKDIS